MSQDRHRRAILRELRRRQSLIEGLRGQCFPEQLAFIDDLSLRKTAQCTRRAGKSYMDGIYFCITAERFPGSTSLYVAPTREMARKIMYRNVLAPLNRKFELNMRINKTTLECIWPNGSILYLIGTDSSPQEADKALGGKYHLVIIDEGQSWRQDQRQLVHAVLEPACADHRGTICFTGSPHSNLQTYFYDITGRNQGDPKYCYGWSRHKWGWQQNPHTQKQVLETVERLQREHPGVEETPFFRQMYLNEWVIDTNRLVYRYNPARNRADYLPTGEHEYLYGCSVDLGFEDDTAFAIAAYSKTDKRMYFVEVYKQRGLDITGVAEKCAYFEQKYHPVKWVIDGAHKQAVAELRNRYNIPFEATDKQGKREMIEMMNADLTLGKIKVLPEAEALVEEWENLIWDDVSTKKIEHRACPNHAADAGLYGWRMCYHYAAIYLTKPPDPNSDEGIDLWWKEQALRAQRAEKNPENFLSRECGDSYGFRKK